MIFMRDPDSDPEREITDMVSTGQIFCESVCKFSAHP